MTHANIPWISQGRPTRVAVIGDVILDEYLVGQVNRISPEAPVPVHLVASTLHAAGGAGNAARNVKLAGGDVSLLSVIGEDDSGRQLRELLANDAIEVSGLVSVRDRPTVRKTRVAAGAQQMVRIDWEKVHPIAESVQNELLTTLRDTDFDALIVSDYDKGALPLSMIAAVLELAHARGVPSVVDPKGRDFSKYLHGTLITPNRNEACDALGLDPSRDWSGEELGRRLQKTFGLQNVLVTMGSKGMVLVPCPRTQKSGAIELPAIAREVYDVSGAGDTVVSIMALALGAKATFEDAMKFAQTAAALVVEKWGTQPIRLEELEAAMSESRETRGSRISTQSKVTSKEQLQYVIKDPSSRNRKVVFTNGCFDILHAGHVSYLEEARSMGDLLVVGVNSDDSVKRLKGPKRPIVSLQDRMRMVAALSCVDFVVPFAEDTPQQLIEGLIPDILVKGADWAKDEIVGADVVRGAGGVVDTISYLPGLSTSQLLERIRES